MFWIYDFFELLYLSFLSPFISFLSDKLDFGSAHFPIKFGFGEVIWFEMLFSDLLIIVFSLFVYVLLCVFVYKFIKWLFSIPKRIGGLK